MKNPAFVVRLVLAVVFACVPLARGADEGYMRIVEDDEGGTLRLEIAIRSFKKADVGPVVHLVGVAHIADKSYYDGMQRYLDAQDLVLFEGVKPAAVDDAPADADDASRAKLTRQRVRMLGVRVEQFRASRKRLPKDLDEAIDGETGPAARMIAAAMRDGWHRPFALERVEAPGERAKFDLVSLGSDGNAGGVAGAADIRLSEMKPITKEEVSAGEGIQVQLAKALKLEFQLAALDYSKGNWRNSDMTVEELTRRLGGEPGEGEGKQNALLGMLSGQSFTAKIAGFILSIIEMSETLSAQTKLMVVEMLGHADELLEAQGAAIMGVDTAQLMKVLIDDRNDVVLEDLERVVKGEPEKKSIAIFYGAGHLAKMQKSLENQGYGLTESQWKAAVTIDLTTFPGGVQAAKASRAMVKRMIEMQLKK